MSTLSYKTISANKNTVKKEWIVIDAENEVVGRLATKVANVLSVVLNFNDGTKNIQNRDTKF